MVDEVRKEKPTDEALNAAAATVEDKPIVENKAIQNVIIPDKVEEDKITPKLDDATDENHPTKLGRKVKRLEEDWNSINSKLDLLLSKMGGSESVEEEINEDSIIATADDVLKVFKSQKGKEIYKSLREEETEEENKHRKTYEREYFNTFETFKDNNSDLHKKIVEEMLKNFNVVKTGKPEIDAEINYSNAKASVLSGMISGKKPVKPNVEGDKNKLNIGLDVSTNNDEDRRLDVNLDEYASEFVKKVGMSAESVKKALSGETPVHLVSKR